MGEYTIRVGVDVHARSVFIQGVEVGGRRMLVQDVSDEGRERGAEGIALLTSDTRGVKRVISEAF